MPDGWASVAFGDLYLIPSKNGLMAPKRVRGEGVPLVNMREIFAFDRIGAQDMELAPLPSTNPGAWLLAEGDLLFARQSLTLEGAGKCSLVMADPRERTFESHIIRVRLDRDSADPRFYFYLFHSPLGRNLMTSIVEQVAAAGIRASDLARLPVPCPPVEEQRRIAGVLGALDDLIDTDERLATVAAAQAEHAWRQIVGSSASSAARVGELATVVLGGTPARNRSEFWHGDIPWLNSGKANDFRVIEPSEMITRAGYESSSTKLMPPGTTLIAVTGATLGQITRLEFEACGNQSLVGVYSPGCPAVNDHLYFAIRDQLPALVGHATGGAQQHINKGNVESLAVVAPDETSLSRWHAIAKPLLESVRELLVEAKDLRAARDELLPLLLSGRVRVEEVAA